MQRAGCHKPLQQLQQLQAVAAVVAVATVATVVAVASFAAVCSSWSDGVVTHAARRGDRVVLDRFDGAEPSVSERLNLVAEMPPVLVIAENAEAEAVHVHAQFRLLATCTMEALNTLCGRI